MITAGLNEWDHWNSWTMHSLVNHKLDSNLPTRNTARQAQLLRNIFAFEKWPLSPYAGNVKWISFLWVFQENGWMHLIAGYYLDILV